MPKFVNIGQVKKSRKGKEFIKANDYKGKLFFISDETGETFEVQNISLFDSKSEYASKDLAINLETEFDEQSSLQKNFNVVKLQQEE